MGREAGNKTRGVQWSAWSRGRRVESGCMGMGRQGSVQSRWGASGISPDFSVTGGKQSILCSCLGGGNSYRQGPNPWFCCFDEEGIAVICGSSLFFSFFPPSLSPSLLPFFFLLGKITCRGAARLQSVHHSLAVQSVLSVCILSSPLPPFSHTFFLMFIGRALCVHGKRTQSENNIKF